MGKQKAGGITWCDYTWNPLRGCTRVSEGCTRCYAERQAARFAGVTHTHMVDGTIQDVPGPFHGFATQTAEGPRWTGKVELVERHLHDPQKWKTPGTVFVNSMSDTFIEGPDQDEWNFTERIYVNMVNVRLHVYLVLTKRARRMLNFCRRWDMGVDPSLAMQTMDHIWHGVSVENQATADERIPLLLDTPCAHRYLSMEPLIGPVNLKPEWLGPGKIEWIIVGGESGPDARPMHPDWARVIRDQCAVAGAHFHFKQWGEWEPIAPIYETPGFETAANAHDLLWPGEEIQLERSGHIAVYSDGDSVRGHQPNDLRTWLMIRSGKRRAGRMLDGVTHDWMPRPEGGQ